MDPSRASENLRDDEGLAAASDVQLERSMKLRVAIACLVVGGFALACSSPPPADSGENFDTEAPRPPGAASADGAAAPTPPPAGGDDAGAPPAGDDGGVVNVGSDASAEAGVPTAGLVAHYALDGDGADSAPNPAPATVHGAVVTADRFGRASHALSFNGTTAYLDAPSKKLPAAANPRTLSVWFRTAATAPAFQSGPNWGSTTATGDRFGISVMGKAAGSTGVLRFSAQNSGVSGSTVVADGKWHHGAVTFDGAVVALYSDGALVKTDNTLTLNTVGTTLSIGRSVPANDNDYFSGQLDDVRIYDRALSAAEIAAIFHEPQ